jgi:hypothetical protein
MARNRSGQPARQGRNTLQFGQPRFLPLPEDIADSGHQRDIVAVCDQTGLDERYLNGIYHVDKQFVNMIIWGYEDLTRQCAETISGCVPPSLSLPLAEKHRKSAAEQPACGCYFVRSTVPNPGFPRDTKYRWLIICCETAKTASHRLRGLSLFAGSKCLINGGQFQSSFIGQLRATSAWTAFEISVLLSHLRPNNTNASVANTTRSGWSVGSRRAPAGRRRRGSRARGPGWFRCGCGFRFAARRGRRRGGTLCNRRDRRICSAAG